MKQFSYSSLRYMDYGGKYWLFECAMIGTCRPIFDTCEDNHEVEQKLRRVGVIRKNTETDSEMCSLVVLFKSRKAGERFIDRLNKYLAVGGNVAEKLHARPARLSPANLAEFKKVEEDVRIYGAGFLNITENGGPVYKRLDPLCVIIKEKEPCVENT